MQRDYARDVTKSASWRREMTGMFNSETFMHLINGIPRGGANEYGQPIEIVGTSAITRSLVLYEIGLVKNSNPRIAKICDHRSFEQGKPRDALNERY